MPIHDWTRVDAGIFHDFHHAWIEQIKRALNGGLLPDDYYALAEQHAAGFGPDVLTLQAPNGEETDPGGKHPEGQTASALLQAPKVQLTAETDMQFYNRKQNTVTVRHVSGDRVVAMVEVVSPGNKSGRHAMRTFVVKAGDLIYKGVHLLILDLHPPGPRDPNGIHALIWEDLSNQSFEPPADKSLTVAAYESGLTWRAYVQPVAVGDTLVDMPLFLEPGAHVDVPLEATYCAAFDAVPKRWRGVLQP